MAAGTATPRVYTVPPGEPFLDRLVAAVLGGHLPEAGGEPPGRETLSDWLILLPTRRACRTLQEAFIRAVPERAMLLPHVRPIGDGDDEASLLGDAIAAPAHLPLEAVPAAIGGLERRLVLTRLVMSWQKAEVERADREPSGLPLASPARASALAAELGRLLDLAETEEIDLGRLAGLVPEAHAEHWGRTLAFLEIITRFWPMHLAERGLASPGERRRRLLDAEAERLRRRPPPGPVIVAGVTGSVPASLRLMQAVAGLPEGALVLPGLDLTLAEDAWAAILPGEASHPQFRLARLLTALGVERSAVRRLGGSAPSPIREARAHLLGEAMRPPATTAAWADLAAAADQRHVHKALEGLSLVEAVSAEEEAEAISLMLRHAAETPGRTAALITPDRILARRVAVRLESWGIRVDDSAGRPLAKTVPGAFLDLIAQAIESRFAPAALMALLKHPLTRLGQEVGTTRRAARAIELLAFRRPYLGEGLAGIGSALRRATEDREDRPLRVHPAVSRLSESDRAAAADLLARLEAAFEPWTALAADAAEHPLDRLVGAHVAVAETLATDRLGSCEALWLGEAGEAAARLLAGLMDPTLPHLRLAPFHYPELYRSLVAGEVVRPLVPTHPRLFIWGPFEARLQQTDLIVLGGLNEGTWPEPADPGPWLSRPMLAELGLPQPETRIGDLAHDLTQHLLAPRVLLTRASKIDGVPTVASRWVLRLRAVLAGLGLSDALTAADAEPWIGWARHRDDAGTRRLLPRPAPRPPVEIRPRRMSVTRIEAWMANPYAVFARDILRLEPMPPMAGELDAALRGAVIHEALNRFTRAHPAEVPEDGARALERLFATILDELAAAPRIAAFWRPRFGRFAEWFAGSEPERRLGVARIVSEVAGRRVLEAPAGPFVLTARADRIDIRRDGRLLITDYKSGKAPAEKRVTEGYAPQLALEAAIAAAGGFEGVEAAEVAGLRYISASGTDVEKAEQRLDGRPPADLARDALDGLTRLIARFDDPATPYACVRRNAYKSVYTFDGYAHLARIKEWASEEPEEPADG